MLATSRPVPRTARRFTSHRQRALRRGPPMHTLQWKTAMLAVAIAAAVGQGAVVTPAALANPGVPTYNADVASILSKRCVECHRPEQVAPMSLLTYQEVRPWARAIKSKVTAREMPP